MANFTTSKKSTRKARRKDDGARVTAHALSQGRSAKAQGQLKSGGSPDIADTADEVPTVQVPTVADEQSPGGYVDREHVRRDIGSHVLVLDLAAADAPADAPKPFLDPDGAEQRFAAQCISHDQVAFFGSLRQATTAAKASHQWCSGCSDLLSGTAKVHSKARAQQRKQS